MATNNRAVSRLFPRTTAALDGLSEQVERLDEIKAAVDRSNILSKNTITLLEHKTNSKPEEPIHPRDLKFGDVIEIEAGLHNVVGYYVGMNDSMLYLVSSINDASTPQGYGKNVKIHVLKRAPLKSQSL